MQKKIFVLIIEFHRDWEPFYRKILQHKGYVVETLVTNNSEDAVKTITDFQPDLVIYRPGFDYELLNVAIRIYQIYSTTRPKNLVICITCFIPQEYLFCR